MMFRSVFTFIVPIQRLKFGVLPGGKEVFVMEDGGEDEFNLICGVWDVCDYFDGDLLVHLWLGMQFVQNLPLA